jgi:hypothetical protein
LQGYLDAFEEHLLSQHFVEDHACSPDITFFGVSFFIFAEVDLGTSIERGSHLSRNEDAGRFSSESEVTDLNVMIDAD